ncbi:MAG TPA: hypothetical protein VJL10_01395, partial [Anaerolineales bacterium]|nr:hypothetical protein [Anaerolineales bacterium]
MPIEDTEMDWNTLYCPNKGCQYYLDSTVKCNRLIEEYFKRRLEVKAFSRTMIEPVYSNLG